MRRTKTQNKQIHALLSKLGLKDQKDALALDFSEGRTDRTSELTFLEAQQMILSLSSATRSGKSFNYNTGVEFKPGNNMRRKIFFFFRKAGYVNAKDQVDVKAVHAWVDRYGYLNKPLMEYDLKELPKLVSQAEAMYESFKESINK